MRPRRGAAEGGQIAAGVFELRVVEGVIDQFRAKEYRRRRVQIGLFSDLQKKILLSATEMVDVAELAKKRAGIVRWAAAFAERGKASEQPENDHRANGGGDDHHYLGGIDFCASAAEAATHVAQQPASIGEEQWEMGNGHAVASCCQGGGGGRGTMATMS